MLHMAAFGFTPSNTGAGVYVTLPAKQDGYLSLNANNRFLLPAGINGAPTVNTIYGAYAQGVEMLVARINNATLRAIGLPSVPNVVGAAAVPTAVNIAMLGMHGPKLPVADEFGLEADSTGTGVQTGFMWLGDGVANIASGPIYALQFTASITTVANTWTAGNITFTQTLPVGRYQVVGMDVVGTTCIGARLVFPNGGPRPGCIGRAAITALSQNQFRGGVLGNWGEFTNTAQPQIEVFASSAAAIVFAGQLDVIKVG